MGEPLKVDEPLPLATRVSDDDFKAVLYETISKMVKDQTGRLLPKKTAKQILERLTEMIFRRVVETGYFRWPAGYGSMVLHKLRHSGKPKTMPDGSKVFPKPEAFRVRYHDGVAVKEMVGNNPHKYRRKKPRAYPFEFDPPTV